MISSGRSRKVAQPNTDEAKAARAVAPSCICDSTAGDVAGQRECYTNQWPMEEIELCQDDIGEQNEGAQHDQEGRPNEEVAAARAR